MAGAGGESGAGETLCEECRACAFKYKCPGCGAKTCSLACVRAHKARTSCTGLRDKTKYLPMDKMGDRELFSDIAFLDDAKRVRDVARRCRPIPPRKENNFAKAIESSVESATAKLNALYAERAGRGIAPSSPTQGSPGTHKKGGNRKKKGKRGRKK